MIWLQLALAWWVGVGVGADYGTTRAALESGWMKEVGWCAVRCGIPFTVLARGAIGVACCVVMARATGQLQLVAAVSAWVLGAASLTVAMGNVRRLWRGRR